MSRSDQESAERGSYRRIFASTALIGGASVITIVLGAIRMKAVAVLLGPGGVGLIGLLTVLMNTAATISQFGMNAVATRQIAAAQASGVPEDLVLARRGLLVASVALALAGGLIVWFARGPLAGFAVGDASEAYSVGLIAVGVALSVLAAAQTAVLRGLRRIVDLANISILGALVPTVLGIPLIWNFGEGAIPFFVLLTPFAGLAASLFYSSRLPRLDFLGSSFADLRPHWVIFLRLGLPIVAGAVIGSFVELWLRIDVRQQLGPEAVGYFQASWTIAEQYVGLVLTAMAADYFPRLASVVGKREEACALINQQSEVALLLSAPLIVTMFALAPWILSLLYAPEFSPAADMLRWQASATTLKVVSWPLGYMLLASGSGRTYFLVEAGTMVGMALLAHILMPIFGISGLGMAYLASYVGYLPIVYMFAARRVRFRWSYRVRNSFLSLVGLLALVAISLVLPSKVGFAISAACIAACVTYAASQLSRMGVLAMIATRLPRPWRTD